VSLHHTQKHKKEPRGLFIHEAQSTIVNRQSKIELRSFFPRAQIHHLFGCERIDLHAHRFEFDAGTSHRREKRAGLLLREAINPELLPIY